MTPVERGVRYEGRRVVRAPLHRVWQLLSRPEAHPRYAALWFAADLLERAPGAVTVEYRGVFGGLPVTSVQRVTLRPPGRIEFRQTRGTLRGLSGSYVLRESDGDTEVAIALTVDAGIPLFSEAAVQQILAAHVDSTLGKIKASAERDLVRLVRRAPMAPAAPEPAVSREEPEPVVAAAGDAGAEAVDAGEEDASADAVGAPGASPPGRRRRRRRRRRRASGAPPANDPAAPAS
ncbi:MAG: SRPBCC family protein [Armatimonadota bacterium]|nr:SRPBCC family protein [Armatimonadota bacterium]MDR7423581.1 SRPBCC family protein [Armatimonadota bacterium]MDR7453803.1 SRPBCC family protein [Armatimonadota bacterium]MDR7455946.1 SRPBCC family protein [Armatimonadota bacterium]